MPWLFTVMLLFCSLSVAQAEPCTQPEDCGIGSSATPDYTLTDVNPNSPTYGTDVSRADHLGEVTVIYFSAAT